MSRFAPYEGDPGAFEHVVHDLALTEEVRVLALDPNACIADTPGGVVVVVRAQHSAVAAVPALLARVRAETIVVLIVGGQPAEHAWQQPPRISALHLAESGVITPNEPDSPGRWLASWLEQRVGTAVDWERFWALRQRASAELAAESNGFQRRLQANTPWATRVLVVVMIGIFGVELLADTLDPNLSLGFMGALNPGLVAQGQVWRILTATLLHGSLLHVGMNLFVLWRVGDLIERILGTARFIVLYTFSGICGSLLSLMFLGEGSSIGASGAIWGVMTAQLVLSYRAKEALPEAVRKAMRANAGQNLVLNLFISFTPGIDAAGHIGGGLGGALAALVLAAGLPQWSDAAEGDNARVQAPLWARAAAVVCAVLLAIAAVITVLGAAAMWFLSQE